MSAVSVIMSTYCRNRPEGRCPNLLRRALDSVIGQTFGDFELVLIDDGSVDGTRDVCREYAARDSRVRLFRAKRNSNLSAKRYNDGMRLAKSDLFMYMFDDDELYPDGMRFLVESVRGKNAGCGMVYGLTNYVDEKSGRMAVVGGDWNYEELRRRDRFCVLCNLSVIVRRSVIDEVGGYDESPVFRRNCDWDLWVRIGKRYPVAGIWRLIGRLHQGYGDSVGETVEFLESDREEAVRVQGLSDRRVRLQGEMGLSVDSVLEDYE